MKSLLSYSLLAAAMAAGVVSAQNTATTTPVGYVTQSLAVGFNVVGLTVHSSIAAAGTITAVNGTTLTTSADLSGLTAGRYLIEIKSGTNAGTVIEADSFAGNNFQNIVELPAGLVNATFSARKAATLETVFGTSLRQDFTAAGADVVWVQNGSGGYNRYFLQTDLFGGPSIWVNAGNNTAAPNIPLTHLDAVFIEAKAAKDLVLSGEVKVSNTVVPLGAGFSLVSLIYPAGVSLSNAGLNNFFDADFTSAGADILWVPNGPGVYTRYYRQSDLFGGPTKWVITPGDVPVADPTTVILPSGVFIENKGAAINATLTVPNYSL